MGGGGEKKSDGDMPIAVIIVDDFNEKFAPLTDQRAKCLLPLANRPLIDYSLDLLRRSGVRETYVYCSALAPQIRSHLKHLGGAGMTVSVILNGDCCSVGDAMRDLDVKGLLRDHFILMTCGGAVGNVNLGAVWRRHKERCKEDKRAAMTLVHKRGSHGNHLRTADEELVMAIGAGSRKILHYAKQPKGRNVRFPAEAFGGADEKRVELSFDHIDTGVAVCSPVVPPLFSDNFDCQTMDDFVRGTIEDDLTDHALYSHVLCDETYLAKLTDFSTYFSVTLDVLNRWAYPHVPDSQGGYCIGKHLVYRTSTSSLQRGSCLDEKVVVGHRTSVGPDSVVSFSSVGSGCSIGSNVVVKNCVILDNATIMDGCRLFRCVIGDGAQVGRGVVVNERCVLGSGVVVKSDVELPESTWLVSASSTSDNTSEFGPGAAIYSPERDSDSEASDEESNHQPGDHLAATLEKVWGRVASGSDDDDDASSESDGDSEISEMIDQMGGGDILLDDDLKLHVFRSEVLESLQRGSKEGIKENNLVLEINSSRHAYAVTAAQVIQAVALAVLSIAQQSSAGPPSNKQLLSEIEKNVVAFKAVLVKYVKNVNSQVDLLKGVEMFFLSQKLEVLPIVAKVIHRLYDLEIVSEDSIRRWECDIGHDDEENGEEEFVAKLKEKLLPLMEWLSDGDDDGSSDETQ